MSRKKKPSRRVKRVGRAPSRDEASTHQAAVRIIGGHFKGTRLVHLGDQRTRPMKHRVREAMFNLVGPAVGGMHAVDLFAGTGALALEAISRGAAEATMVERHFPTVRCIEAVAIVLREPVLGELARNATQDVSGLAIR